MNDRLATEKLAAALGQVIGRVVDERDVWYVAVNLLPAVREIAASLTAAPTGPDPRTDAAPDMRVHREGDWWVIEVPGVGVTQARREEDIERMARDLVESLADDGDARTDAAVER